ncbi:tape measure protein [Alcanivoracaceae bacterium MT1]
MAQSRLRELIVRITADSSVYQREMARASRMGSDYYRSMESGARRAEAAFRRQQDGLRDFNTRLEAVKGQALSMGAVIATAFAAGNLISSADDWNMVTARLRQATESQAEFNRVREELFDLSQRTGTVFAANANLFARSAASMREFNFAAAETVGVTEAVALGLQLSGANAADSESVIRQFTQALAQGVLRGEEFNAVNESGDRVVRALAAGMGVARKDLKAMADDGLLTIDKVVPALVSQLGTLRAEFEDLPGSVQRSSTRVANSFARWTAGQDGATGSTQALAKGLDAVADNMDLVAGAALTLIAGGAAKYFTGMAVSAGRAAIETAKVEAQKISLANAQALAARQAALEAENERLAAAESLKAAQSKVAAAEAGVVAERQAIAAQLERIKSTQTSMAAERALETQRLKAQYTDKGRQLSLTRLGEIRTIEAGLTKQQAALEQQLAATTVGSSKTIEAAYAARAAAAGKAAQATKVANAAAQASERASAAASATTGLTRAGGAVLGLLGGPAGLVSLAAMAATSWYLFRDGTDAARESLIDINTPLEEAKQKFAELSSYQRELQLIEWGREQKEKADEAREAFQDLDSGINAALGRRYAGAVPDEVYSQYQALVRELRDTQESGGDLVPVLQRIQEELRLPGKDLESWFVLADRMDRNAAAARNLVELQAQLGTEFERTTESVQGQGNALVDQTKELDKYLARLQERAAKAVDDSELGAARRFLSSNNISAESDGAQRILKEAAALDRSNAAREKAKEIERERDRTAKQLRNAYESQAGQYARLVALGDDKTELARLEYELESGKLQGLKAEEQQRLRNLAVQVDQLTQQREYKDMMSGLLTASEQLNEKTRERWKILEATKGLSEQEYLQAREAISKASVTDAPKFGGLDASVGGAAGELARVAEADAALAQWREAELERQQKFLADKEINELEHARRVREIEQETADQRRDINAAYMSAVLGTTSQLTGDMASMMAELGDKSSTAYKIMFAASKAASIAQAIVNTEVAATKALAEGATIFGIPAATAIRGIGYASVGIIASQTIAGMAHDGLDTIPQDGTWFLQRGERVVDRRTNADLKQFLQGNAAAGGGGDTFVFENHFHGDGRTEGTAPAGMESVAQEIRDLIDRRFAQRLRDEIRPGGMLYRNQRAG